MNIAARCLLLSLLAPFSIVSTHATEVSVGGRSVAIDCAKPAMLSQRVVAELVGQHNFSQVYATRTRLMAEVRRACQRAGTTRVLVNDSRQSDQRPLALQRPTR